jgi:hypothetical protein
VASLDRIANVVAAVFSNYDLHSANAAPLLVAELFERRSELIMDSGQLEEGLTGACAALFGIRPAKPAASGRKAVANGE